MVLDQEHVPFSERSEWADVLPVEQYENITPLAPIFYPPFCMCLHCCLWVILTPVDKDATDYLRGIIKIGEKSPRVLDLTEAIIRQNPAHYTAWYVCFSIPIQFQDRSPGN